MSRKNDSWHDIRRALSRHGTGGASSAETFWPRFHARRQMLTQLSAHRARNVTRPVLWWSGATAFATLLLAAAFLGFHRSSAGEAAVIRSYEVPGPHGSVVILRDAPSDTTILWIVDMQSPHPHGNHS